MPNWCENDLEVSGSTDDITKFKEQSKGVPMDKNLLNHFVPMPKELEGTKSPPDKDNPTLLEKFGATNWYDWHIKNWGTKWDVEGQLAIDQPRRLVYTFDSAWSPPIEWLEKVSKLYPNLRFTLKYNEPGIAYRGTAKAHKGVLTDKCKQN